MGCGSSTPAADGHQGGKQAAPVEAVKRAAESLSPAAFETLKSDVLAHAGAGDFSDAYELGLVLGAGAFGVVRSAKQKSTGTTVAVKTLPLPPDLRKSPKVGDNGRQGTGRSVSSDGSGSGMDFSVSDADPSEVDAEDILKEVSILRRLNNPYVLHLIDYYLTETSLHIVMDLLPGGPLLDHILAEGSHGYTEREALLAFQPLLRALHYLHSHDITHRDVKLDNLLLARPRDFSSAVLCDFGLASSHFESGQDGMRWCCGSAAYMAPEVARRQIPYSNSVDLWSAGVVLHLLLTGLTPFAPLLPPGSDPEATPDDDAQLAGAEAACWKVALDGAEWAAVSAPVKDLAAHLLSINPDERPAASAALAHACFDELLVDKKKAPLSATTSHLRRYAKALELPVAEYKKGAFLGTQGERCKNVFLVKAGLIEVLLPAPSASGGATTYTVAYTAGPGELVGEMDVQSIHRAASQSLLNHQPSFTRLPSFSLTPPGDAKQQAPAAGPSAEDMVAIARLRRVASKWVGKRRRTTLRAAQDSRVVVLNAKDMNFYVSHDHALAVEVEALAEKTEHLVRQSSGAARS